MKTLNLIVKGIGLCILVVVGPLVIGVSVSIIGIYTIGKVLINGIIGQIKSK